MASDRNASQDNTKNFSGAFNHATDHARLSDLIHEYIKHIHIEGEWKLSTRETTLPFMAPRIKTRKKFNEKIALKEGNYAVLIKHKNQAGEVQQVAYVADAKCLNKLVRYGIYEPESLTAKAVAMIGKYRIDALNRLDGGYKTQHAEVKENTLAFTQDLIESLQDLERLVHSNSPQALKDCFDKLKADLSQLYSDGIKVLKADVRMKSHLEANLNQMIHKIDVLSNKRDLTKLDLKHFLVDATTAMVRQGQALNEAFTYDARFVSINRGLLNNYFEDALKVINDFDYDWTRPVLPEHQGKFDTADGEKGVFLSRLHGIVDLDDLALIIDDIEGKLEAATTTVYMPQWTGAFGRMYRAIKNGVIEGVGIILDTLSLPVRFILAPILISLRINPFKYSVLEALRERKRFDKTNRVTEAFNQSNDIRKTWFYKAGKYVGLGIVSTLKPLYDTIESAHVGFKRKLAEFEHELRLDLSPRKPDVAPVSEDNQIVSVNDFETEPTDISESPVAKKQSDKTLEHPGLINASGPKLFYPAYRLLDEESMTIFTAAAQIAQNFTDNYFHEIYAKSPILGLIYTSTAVATGGVVVAPHMFSLAGGQQFVQFMQNGISPLANGTIQGAFSVGTNYARSVITIIDFIANGRESAAYKSIRAMGRFPTEVTLNSVAITGIISHISSDVHIALFGLGAAATAYEMFLEQDQRVFLNKDVPVQAKGDGKEYHRIMKEFGYHLSYLPIQEKLALLALYKGAARKELESIMFPQAQRGVLGETLYRLFKPLARVVSILTSFIYAITHWSKFVPAIRFCGKEVVNLLYRDLLKDIGFDLLKAGGKLVAVAASALGRFAKATASGFAALASKALKVWSMVKGVFVKMDKQAPYDMPAVTAAKSRLGHVVDNARREALFAVKKLVEAPADKMDLSVLTVSAQRKASVALSVASDPGVVVDPSAVSPVLIPTVTAREGLQHRVQTIKPVIRQIVKRQKAESNLRIVNEADLSSPAASDSHRIVTGETASTNPEVNEVSVPLEIDVSVSGHTSGPLSPFYLLQSPQVASEGNVEAERRLSDSNATSNPAADSANVSRGLNRLSGYRSVDLQSPTSSSMPFLKQAEHKAGEDAEASSTDGIAPKKAS